MIRIRNLAVVNVQNQLVLMLKDPIEVVYSSLEETIGKPRDIAANLKANGSVNFNLETPIPRATAPSSKHNSSAMAVDQIASEPVQVVHPFSEDPSAQPNPTK